MPVQTQHRFSVADYHRMAETGVLPPGARVELLLGRIIDRSPIGPFHGGVVNRLSRLFNLKAKGRWVVSTQNPLRLEDHSEPEPDIMLLRPRADDYTSRHPEPDDVLLLIEVADTTLDYDRGQKLPAYARAGVSEVWVVNLIDRRIEVYRGPGDSEYGSRSVEALGGRISPQSLPDVAIDLNELFRR